ncbi:hypothetical protein GC722_03310 [Auraticoccus sp. F435]|uniref:VCBS repeat-containing protein n=1 Tax=Auraticoccus cholistanensis TaxID=2656650 RepID=A0A6A9UQW7_9ACTN|nr:VCBS repeat-containing protein [Auraticoccus cholistanensis]MVA75061.1 hypothetical protein [Auraticoccus cholistanensis]
MRSHRALTVALVSTGLLLSGVAAGPPAHAAGCRPSAVPDDIDRDGRSDLVVGDPYADRNEGRVEVVYNDGRRAMIRRSQLPGDPGDASFFGSAVALGDFTGDGCLDLAVGSPSDGYVEPEDADDGGGDPGRPAEPKVFVLRGTSTGITTSDPVVVLDPEMGEYSGFGNDLAVLQPYPDSRAQLVVGMPSRDGGRGGVAFFAFDDDGQPGEPVLVDRDTPGVDGSATPDSMFGASLATIGHSVLVGADGTAVSGRRRAGSVTMLTNTDAAPQTFKGVSYSQDSAGVSGGAETNDRFGYSVAAHGGWVAVGVPEENLGEDVDAGAVQLFRRNAGAGTLTPVQMVSQETAGVPGGSEDYDRFGSSVTVGRGLQRAGVLALAVAAENEEDDPDVPDTGAWTVLDLPTLRGSRYSLSSPGVPGADARGAGAFMHVAVLGGPQAATAERRDALVVALPSRSRGRVLVSPPWLGSWESFQSGDYPTSAEFGAAVS